jgi:hypothetical protein
MLPQTAAALLKLWQRALTIALSGQLLAECVTEVLAQRAEEAALAAVPGSQHATAIWHCKEQLNAARIQREQFVSEAAEARGMVERLDMVVAAGCATTSSGNARQDSLGYRAEQTSLKSLNPKRQDSLGYRAEQTSLRRQQQEKQILVVMDAGVDLSDACSALYECRTSSPASLNTGMTSHWFHHAKVSSATFAPRSSTQGHLHNSMGQSLSHHLQLRGDRDAPHHHHSGDEASSMMVMSESSAEVHCLLLKKSLRQLQDVRCWLQSLMEATRRREVELQGRADRFKRISADRLMKANRVVVVRRKRNTAMMMYMQ